MWWIIFAVLALFILLRLFVWFFGNWRLTLTRLADSYIYGIEQEKLSDKKTFLNTLQLRYQLKKTDELIDELEKQGLSEEEIQNKTSGLLRSNSLRQDTEYRYEFILKRKGFIKEAVDLSSSRSLVEGGMWASQKIENEMEDLYGTLRDDRGYIKDGDYSLMELLVCGMMIEYSHEIKKKKYTEVTVMIKNYFKNRPYYSKYLNK